MEEKEFDNIESLAAFLHSGSDKTEPVSEIKKTETGSSAKKSAAVQTPEKRQRVSDEDLSAVLFSIENKKKKPSASLAEQAMRKSEEPLKRKVPVKKQEPESDISFDAENIKPKKGTIHYDNAATQMMEIGSVHANPTRTAELAQETEADEDVEEKRRSRREISEIRAKYERQRLGTRTFAYILLGAFLSVVIIGVSAYISSYIVTFALDLTGIATTEFELDIEIPENANTDVVAAILSENNIIKSPKFFKEFGKLMGKSDSFYSGTYTLSSTMSYPTIYSTLQSRSYETKTVTLRIAEGMTAEEIGQLLEENKVCYASDFEKCYKSLQNNYDFERRLSVKSAKYNQLEGYLFPDTYEFYAVLDTQELIYDSEEELDKAKTQQREKEIENAETAAKKMYSNFNDKITKVMYKKMGEMNMTLDEVVTLASMVQKEAASVDDMYYVASVFLNRIRNSEEFPYLQSDVTTLYVENNIKPNVKDSAKVTRYSEVYNTYVCKGIPVGPICNPGLDAIDAVLNAADTNYYYFCANEETGEVFYATTHEEHEANLIKAGLTGTDNSSDDYAELE